MNTHGPEIITESLSRSVAMGSTKALWQYHSRSDRHSKITCWCVMFDLLRQSPVLRLRVEAGEVGFGINHRMVDFKADRRKDLDLVICRPVGGIDESARGLRELADHWGVVLTEAQKMELEKLPVIKECGVGAVEIAMEAKACMTEHSKARPRLYDELNSSHATIHGASSTAIAAGFVMINAASKFQSPTRVGVTEHRQPKAADSVIEKVKQLPRRASTSETGYDALAILVVDCINDGMTPVTLVPHREVAGEIYDYSQSVQRVAQLYASRFPQA